MNKERYPERQDCYGTWVWDSKVCKQCMDQYPCEIITRKLKEKEDTSRFGTIIEELEELD